MTHPAKSSASGSSLVPNGRPFDDASAAPVKVAILGAGSTVFARRLITDLLMIPALERGSFALVDIDTERLELAHQIGEKRVAQSGRDWTVEAASMSLPAGSIPQAQLLVLTLPWCRSRKSEEGERENTKRL